MPSIRKNKKIIKTNRKLAESKSFIKRLYGHYFVSNEVKRKESQLLWLRQIQRETTFVRMVIRNPRKRALYANPLRYGKRKKD